MRTSKTILVEKHLTTFNCDFCPFEAEQEHNRGYLVMLCHFCKKDACRNCREFYTEDEWEDYPHGAYVCKECKPRADKAWYIAKMTAGRYQDILEVMEEWFNDEQLEATYDDF